jgi:uncharacterized protein (TIGR03663 family)
VSKRRLQIALSVLILVLALALRWSQIDLRPFHADEAVQACQTAKLLDGEGYRYDPGDKHGPFLYYGALSIARVAGWPSSSLTETRLRFVSVLAGLALLSLMAINARSLGERRTLLAMLFVAMAPMTVLYQSYFVQEAWFCFFTWALLFAIHRYFLSPSLALGMLLGLLAALMQACKETSVLHFAAIAAALVFAGTLRGPRLGGLALHLPRLGAALATGLVVYALFYSSFGTNPRGILDGMTSYLPYASKAVQSPHVQPWHAYLDILMPHRQEGVMWGEVFLLVCAAFGAVRVLMPGSRSLMRLVFWFTATVFFLYSIIPYKTPWLVLTPYVGVCILAASGLVEAWKRFPRGKARTATVALGILCVGELSWRTHLALFRYAGDERVPYFYQQTSPDFPRLLACIREQVRLETARPLRIAVCSPDHAWPLPWYLRAMPSVGYFSTAVVPEGFDLIIGDSRLSPSAGNHNAVDAAPIATFGLRPNVVLQVSRRDKR